MWAFFVPPISGIYRMWMKVSSQRTVPPYTYIFLVLWCCYEQYYLRARASHYYADFDTSCIFLCFFGGPYTGDCREVSPLVVVSQRTTARRSSFLRPRNPNDCVASWRSSYVLGFAPNREAMLACMPRFYDV